MKTEEQKAEDFVEQVKKWLAKAILNGQDIRYVIHAGSYCVMSDNPPWPDVCFDESATFMVIVDPLPPEQHRRETATKEFDAKPDVVVGESVKLPAGAVAIAVPAAALGIGEAERAAV